MSARHSLRPLNFRRRDVLGKPRAKTRGEIAELCLEPGDTKTLVMPGLDPGIHLLRKSFLEADVICALMAVARNTQREGESVSAKEQPLDARQYRNTPPQLGEMA